MTNKYIEREPLVAYLYNMKAPKHIIEAIINEERFPVLNLDTIANNVETKMTYMCGCYNCIDIIRSIITNDDNTPIRKNQCNKCNQYNCIYKSYP